VRFSIALDIAVLKAVEIIMKINEMAARILICLCTFLFAHHGFAAPSYKINPGDFLAIDVWNEDSLTRDVVVSPDGYISFPLAGSIMIGGSTTLEAEDAVSVALGKFLKDTPTVTISVKQLAGNKIYIIGKVLRPGEYPINRPTDVMQALSIAGGLNTFASENNIKILRRLKTGEQTAISFEYGEVKAGEDLETNIVLQSGDVVVVR